MKFIGISAIFSAFPRAAGALAPALGPAASRPKPIAAPRFLVFRRDRARNSPERETAAPDRAFCAPYGAPQAPEKSGFSSIAYPGMTLYIYIYI